MFEVLLRLQTVIYVCIYLFAIICHCWYCMLMHGTCEGGKGWVGVTVLCFIGLYMVVMDDVVAIG